ncbi:MAG: hypothetical protein ACK4Q4_09730 [Rhodocyclaceae bacterium]
MRLFLILLNAVLLFAIVFVMFFWEPELHEDPVPGTHDARVGRDVTPNGATRSPP